MGIDFIPVPRIAIQRMAELDAFNAPKGAAMEISVAAKMLLNDCKARKAHTIESCKKSFIDDSAYDYVEFILERLISEGKIVPAQKVEP